MGEKKSTGRWEFVNDQDGTVAIWRDQVLVLSANANDLRAVLDELGFPKDAADYIVIALGSSNRLAVETRFTLR